MSCGWAVPVEDLPDGTVTSVEEDLVGRVPLDGVVTELPLL